MKILKAEDLKGLSTEDLFSISVILQNPRIDTKKRFLESFDGAKVDPSSYKSIIQLLDEPKIDVYSRDEIVSINSYYSSVNSLVNIKNANVIGKVIEYYNGKVLIQIQAIGTASAYTPALYTRIYCPISSISKLNTLKSNAS